MRNLNKIALEKGTDKSSQIHDYCRKYEKWLPFNRLEPLVLLEIGVLNGSSIRMWREYYPNAKVVGLDINPDCKKIEDLKSGIYVETGSQIDTSFLDRVVYEHGPFDFIVDDGSHVNSHVVFSFQYLFPHLKSEGVYVIEDSCTAYWKEYGGGLGESASSIEYCKSLIDEVNFFGEYTEGFESVHARRDDLLLNQFKQKNHNPIGLEIESINFLNSLIMITKR